MMFLNIILRTALLTPIMVVISFALTIRASLDLSLIIASTIPIIVIGVIIIGKISGPISDRQQKISGFHQPYFPRKPYRHPGYTFL